MVLQIEASPSREWQAGMVYQDCGVHLGHDIHDLDMVELDISSGGEGAGTECDIFSAIWCFWMVEGLMRWLGSVDLGIAE